MLTILFCICMFGIAEREKRNAWAWAVVTAAFSVAWQLLLLPGYWGAVAGLVSAFVLMTYCNIKYPVKKGPHLG
jgi:asparagine N-glycosylation enzyme membrane subunit Stt3